MTVFERLLAISIKPWVIVGFLGLIILSILYLDQPIAYYFYGVDSRNTLYPLNWVTKLGLGPVYFIPLFLLALFFRYVHCHRVWEDRCWILWLCALFPSTICLVLKMVFGRARPDLLFSEQLYGFYGWHTQTAFWSFPSGHTTTVMGFIFGLCALFPRYWYAFLSVGLIVISSRVMLTHHYLSDVLAATYLALLEVGLLLWWLKHNNLLRSVYEGACCD